MKVVELEFIISRSILRRHSDAPKIFQRFQFTTFIFVFFQKYKFTNLHSTLFIKCSSRINVQQVYTSPTCKWRRETLLRSGVILHILHTLLLNTMYIVHGYLLAAD